MLRTRLPRSVNFTTNEGKYLPNRASRYNGGAMASLREEMDGVDARKGAIIEKIFSVSSARPDRG